ncbi:MAG TPA: hypothetical protein VIH30_09350 [Aquirhabdus sp.]
MDRKTLPHHLPSCRIGRYSTGATMKCKPDFSTTWYCKFAFALGVAIILAAWCNSPADERIKPEPIYQVSK